MQFLAQFQVENILFVRPRVLKDSCFCFLLYFRILFSRHLSTFPLSLPHWLRFKHPYCCPSFVPESKWRCSIINQIRQCVLVVVDNAQPPPHTWRPELAVGRVSRVMWLRCGLQKRKRRWQKPWIIDGDLKKTPYAGRFFILNLAISCSCFSRRICDN